MKRFLYEQLVEIKEIHIIIAKMKPVHAGFLCTNIRAKKVEDIIKVML